jgi:tRNA nucleotidyltransferase (CCA-adding enzyme)
MPASLSNTPATIADLMSRGAQTVQPDEKLEAIIRRLRLIGHEGFPVVERGRVVGLLTRRDADRAVEHGLGTLTVRDVMDAGEVTLRPGDAVERLERLIVASGWGQIPVVDDAGKLIGIVTRTDLIKYWASQHPEAPAEAETISSDEIADVLGAPVARLIERVAAFAQERQTALYMVGGVVRDLVLKRRNDDVDFVVEGDAIAFTEALRERFGGELYSYRPFGTATWQLEGTSIHEAGLPKHVDFASARSEFYERPTALPTVYDSSIKLDLQRRDFTINTLAVLLSPVSGRVVDYYGGLDDLRAGMIRVLHSLSFVDDPTRILRAVRFERRLGFSIEPRTAELIETALPMLRRITGERIRNELALLLGETDPAGSFLLLQERGILRAIHPAFAVPNDLRERFERARTTTPAWEMEPPDAIELGWCLLLADVPLDDLRALCERLLFSKTLAQQIVDTARLVQSDVSEKTPPSQIVAQLEGSSDLSLYSAWLIYENSILRQRIQQYALAWRSVRPKTDGRALQARGLKPGPCYGVILARLRAARLDGDIATDAEEDRLLDHLLEQGICDDSAR